MPYREGQHVLDAAVVGRPIYFKFESSNVHTFFFSNKAQDYGDRDAAMRQENRSLKDYLYVCQFLCVLDHNMTVIPFIDIL